MSKFHENSNLFTTPEKDGKSTTYSNDDQKRLEKEIEDENEKQAKTPVKSTSVMSTFNENSKLFITPDKDGRSTTDFNDDLKRQLFHQFITLTSDPLLKSSSRGFKAKLEEQCKQLRNGVKIDGNFTSKPQTVKYKGQVTSWKHLASSLIMMDKMERCGFEGQRWRQDGKDRSRGLHSIITNVVGENDVDTEWVRANEAAFMKEADKLI